MERLSHLGVHLGNWNDRRSHHDRRANAPLRWRVLDAIAGWLYVAPDRRSHDR